MVAVLVVGRNPGGRPLPPGVKRRARRPGSLTGDKERARAYAAQAEIEGSDIDQMIAARDALRRRLGKPSIGDELAAELAEEARREPD